MKRAFRAILLATVVLLVRSPLRWLMMGLVPGDDPLACDLMLSLLQVILWGLPALMLRPRHAAEHSSAAAYGAMIVGGASAQYLLSFVCLLFAGLTGIQSEPFVFPQSTAEVVGKLISLVAVPAVTEELFFRSMLQSNIREDYGDSAAVAVSTVLFALSHGSLSGLPAHLLFGLMLALVMRLWGNVRLCMMLHLSFNLAALMMSAFDMTYSRVWLVILTVAGVLSATLLCLRRLKEAPLGPAPRLQAAPLLLSLPAMLYCLLPYFAN